MAKAFVHFTHHACVVAGLWRTMTDEQARVRDPLDISGRNPHLSLCRYWSRVSKHKAGVWSIDPRAITCVSCRTKLADESEAAWTAKAAAGRERSYYSNWRSDAELVACAWLSCCRHRGAPWPYSDEARVKAEAWYRRKIYEAPFVDAIDAWTHIDTRESVLQRYEAFDETTKARLAPALDMYLLAADRLDGAHMAMRDAASVAAREFGMTYDYDERTSWRAARLSQIREEITDQILRTEEAS